nr:hypothetical protein [Pirellulales bacterium]
MPKFTVLEVQEETRLNLEALGIVVRRLHRLQVHLRKVRRFLVVRRDLDSRALEPA